MFVPLTFSRNLRVRKLKISKNELKLYITKFKRIANMSFETRWACLLYRHVDC